MQNGHGCYEIEATEDVYIFFKKVYIEKTQFAFE